MAASTLHLIRGHNVLLFGPQFLSFTSDSLAKLRTDCLESPFLREWTLQTFYELPRHWSSIVACFPSLKLVPGQQQLEDLVEYIRTGKLLQTPFPLPNLLLCPLVVVLQLAQYLQYQELVQSEGGQAWPSSHTTEAVGFCTGLLSALAVSCSSTSQEVQRYGAAAIRLAMLIGAVVDAGNADTDSMNQAVSLSVAWQASDSRSEVNRILESCVDAYISVAYDVNRYTITASRKDSKSLVQRFKDAGINALEIGLQGRFHDPLRSPDVQGLVEFCDSHPDFAFPDAKNLGIPTRYDGGDCITNGSLHEIALRAILVDQCQWQQAFTPISSRLAGDGGLILSFGLERCVPPSILRDIGHKVVHMADVDLRKPRLSSRGGIPGAAATERVAVVGMSSRVPGANDLEEFWTLLCNSKSQHIEVPRDRFTFDGGWRDVDPERKWYGNFVEDYDAFDNKFFNKSPRESGAMDPQQKMMLQAAYQAVEQSGYYQSMDSDKHIGCFIGVSNVDYQDNVACHPVSAFTATGTLMSFVSGKISHYFGWTGPSMSIDTACSGSAVAIHEACKAILSGECTRALAGGVNAMTSPLWYQNLAGASFLSTTGQCKPFDVKGDGYCRGEAVGAVFLKRLSDAVRDGDPIFGTIAATAVYQNQNFTPITVPNAASLSDLFQTVTSRAGVDPRDITVVEAHGTGTAVGDPAEYDGIRKTLGGPKRSSTLSLSSVKGLVGHSECASGMIALIKTLLMIHEGAIPPQASHDTINPALHAVPSDKIEIPRRLKAWTAPFKAALINNYGASGSNASMVITDAPLRQMAALSGLGSQSRTARQPFWFCATDDQSLGAYAARFITFLQSKATSGNTSLPALSWNVARQSNRSHDRALIFGAESIQELEGKLQSFCRGQLTALDVVKHPRPVILCFGGQISTFVGLDRAVYEGAGVLKAYLDRCDLICKSMGLEGIYPDIFKREPIEDTVQLQTALFAIQYSCAKAWIDCGIQVSAMVGHSFGEIVAQTVAGVLSLTDGLKVIIRRARLIRDSWGSDRGSMMAIEADLGVVESLLVSANRDYTGDRPATIACFNGPRSFTIAGSTDSIRCVEDILSRGEAAFVSVRSKKLNTSHAFHSTLVESLAAELKKITHDVILSKPLIRVERATMTASTAPLTSDYIADHLRQPVYFDHAVRRLAKEFDNTVWLEAGSQSTVTNMASKALGRPTSSHFQDMNLTSADCWKRLTDATVALWGQGVKATFWPHHSSQGPRHAPLILPPYQFKKSKHFLALQSLKDVSAATSTVVSEDRPRGLWTLVEYRDAMKQSARFRVETSNQVFQDLLAGHTVAHSEPLCPSTLQLDIATEAIRSICPEFPLSDFQIDLRNLENQAPLCRDLSREVWLDVLALDASRRAWSWKMVSDPLQGHGDHSLHASGRVIFRSRAEDEFLDEFRRFERLVTHKRCRDILEGCDSDEIFQGSAIYRLFADVVDYSETFRGVRKVVGRSSESAGRVVKKYSAKTVVDTPLCDSFCQVAGVFVNCMTQRPEGEVFISNGVERLVQSPFIRDFQETPEVFDVFALHHRPTDRSYSSDVFIFDAQTSALLGVILGIQYQRVSKLAMSRLLSRLTPGAKKSPPATQAVSSTDDVAIPTPKEALPARDAPKAAQSQGPNVATTIRDILCEMVGVEAGDINAKTNLPDLGIDSLMGMEVARELELAFKCPMDTSSMASLMEFGDLVGWVESALGTDSGNAEQQVNMDPERPNEQDKASSSSDSITGSNHTSGTPSCTSSLSSGSVRAEPKLDLEARQAAVELYVARYSSGFSFTPRAPSNPSPSPSGCPGGHCILITGGTGSLGAHLVRHFAELPSTTMVICFNRPSRMEPTARQRLALEDKGIELDTTALAKLHVIASDTSKPLLGLAEADYTALVGRVTHIVHPAWPMSITRSIHDFEKQFVAMRNLIDLASQASNKLPADSRIGFQFVSSIATVGLYSVAGGDITAPEEASEIRYALPSGYSDAKLVCERLLLATLNQQADRVNAMSVRVGQVAGSKKSGYWNPAEHLSLLIKSAQTLNALPDLRGHLSWLPVEDVAATLSELVLSPVSASPVYHVENPVRQPWSDVVSLLSVELGIPSCNIMPYQDWLDCVRGSPSMSEVENPAVKVIKFLEDDFQRMACGGLVLGTEKATRVSSTLRRAEMVSEDLIRKYVTMWRTMGFLA